MSKVLSRAQLHIQMEEAMETSFNILEARWHRMKVEVPARSLRPRPRSKRGNLPSRDRRSLSFHQIRSEPTNWWTNISLRWGSPINDVFNTINDQSWVRYPRTIQYNPTFSGAEEYCSYHDCKGHMTIYCWALRKYLKEFIQQGFFKKYILTPEAASGSGQLNTPPPAQSQHLIT